MNAMSSLRTVGAIVAAIVAALLPSGPAFAQECASPGADWILCDDFESGAVDTNIWNDGGTGASVQAGTVYDGAYALDMFHPAGSTGGYLNSIWYWTGYTQLHSDGFGHLYSRYWVNFDPGFNSSTKIAGFTVKASDLSGFWDGFVGAGFRPDGLINGGGSRIVAGGSGVGFPGILKFYTYHREMMLDRWTDGGGALQCAYYGDATPPPMGWVWTDTADPMMDYYCSPPGTGPWDELTTLLSGYNPGTYSSDAPAPAGTWTCIEHEMRVNDTGMSNGYQRLWVNDVLNAEWMDIRFAEAPVSMLIHAFQITASSPDSHPADQHTFYDNVVVSTSRVGCSGAPPPGSDAGTAGSDGGTGGSDGGGGATDSGGPPINPPPPDDPGGCSCRLGADTGSRDRGSAGAIVLVALFGIAAVRRRTGRC